MRSARRSLAETLSVSALDLFASALGVFIVMFVILTPFYLKRPSVESGLLGAEERLAEAEDAAAEAAKGAAEARRALASAGELLGGAASEVERRTAELEELKRAEARAQAALAARPEPERETVSVAPQGGGSIAIENLDLVIVMDVTASMDGELEDLQVNLGSIARILNRLSPDLRMGFVAYRDVDSPPVLRSFALSPMDRGASRRMLRFAQSLSARGGGDQPEPVDQALEAATAMAWRENANGRILVVGDAPAHAPNVSRAFAAAAAFAGSGPGGRYDRSVSTIVTGGTREARAFFEALAEAGGGETAAHRGAMIESVLLAALK